MVFRNKYIKNAYIFSKYTNKLVKDNKLHESRIMQGEITMLIYFFLFITELVNIYSNYLTVTRNYGQLTYHMQIDNI